MKILAIGAAILVMLVAGAALILPAFIDWNRYEPQIVAAVQRMTGRTLSIDGDISFRMLPVPALAVDGVRLSNLPGGTAPDMARLRSLDIRVALGPLLSGEVQVESVRLVEPVILLEVTTDGRANWQFDTSETDAPMGANLDRLDFRFEKFVLSDATLIYRNAVTGAEQRFDGISLEGSATSLAGPFTAEGELQAAGLPLSFDARIGRLAAQRSIPLHLTVRTPAGDSAVELAGSLSEPSAAATLSGTVDARTGSLAMLLQAADADTATAGLLDKPLSAEGRIEATLDRATINNLAVLFGNMRAAGSISTPVAGGLAPDITLEMSRVDLDALIADANANPGATAGPGYPALPKGLRGNLHLSIDGVALNGGILRQVQVTAELAEGRLNLSRLSALMPGGSDANLSGTIAMADNLPRFEGRLELASVDLRSLLHWLNIDASSVPAGRLGSLALTSQVRATPRLVEIFDGNLRVDATTITGGLAFFVQRRPSFSAALRIDRINLDGYLPENAAAGLATLGTEGAPLALLNAFDTRLRLEFGQVVYERVPIRDLAVELELIGGVLTLHRAGIADIAGASVRLAGTAQDFADNPAFDFSLDFRADNAGRLARLSGLELPVPPSRLGRIALDAAAAGTADDFHLAGDGTVAGIHLSAEGDISSQDGVPEVALTLLMEHPSLAGLSDMLGTGVTPLGDADGPISLTASAEGGAAALDVDLGLDLVGGTAQLQGRLSDLDGRPSFELKASAGADSFSRLLHSIGFATGSMPGTSEFGLSAELSGNLQDLRIDEISARLGPTTATGSALLTLDGARPHLQATLAADAVRADMFLPTRPQPRMTQWSREPLDLSWLQSLDADLELSAGSLGFGELSLVEPKLTAQLSDGMLQVSQLTGRLFDGTLALAAELRSRPLPALELSYRLAGADMARLLQTLFGVGAIEAAATIEGRLQTTGVSDWDLANALQGDARIDVGDGVIHGIDVAGIGTHLDGPTGDQDVRELIAGALSGGETGFAGGGGSWRIRNGVASTEDTHARLAVGEATLAGRIGIPAWEMDLTSTFTLAAHPEAPPFGLRFHGPLDDPERQLNTDGLARYLAGRAMQDGLQQAPDNRGASQDQPG